MASPFELKITEADKHFQQLERAAQLGGRHYKYVVVSVDWLYYWPDNTRAEARHSKYPGEAIYQYHPAIKIGCFDQHPAYWSKVR